VATTTTTSTPNNVNEITSQSGGVNRMLTYDLNGSITSDGATRTFEWDGANRLIAINYTGFTTRSEFTYDGLSRMVKIVEKIGAPINSTRKFVWAGQEKVEFRDAADAVTQRNYTQGQYVGTTAYFLPAITSGRSAKCSPAGGTVVARYDYDPYGRSTTVLGTTPTDFNFTGLYRHSKSNLDLATYRAYDPDLARWLDHDPLKNAELSQGTNLYAYVSNNPALWNDPTGLERGGGVECDGKNGFRGTRGGFEGTCVAVCVQIHEDSHVEIGGATIRRRARIRGRDGYRRLQTIGGEDRNVRRIRRKQNANDREQRFVDMHDKC
jgi:RHS repeat-associated protein